MTLQAERTTFEDAAREYRIASDAWRLAADSLRDAQSSLRMAQQDQTDIEIDMRLDPTVNEGKNAELREALFDSIAQLNEAWIEARASVEASRKDVQRWTDETATMRDKIALAKRQMDFSIAWVQFISREGGENGS